MPKVVCRIQKLKSPQKIGQASKHNLRLDGEAKREHLNPNPSMPNKILLGSDNILNDVNAKLQTVEKNANGEFRSNAVLGVEMILSASPEYFSSKEKLDQWVQAQEKFLKEEYGSNCVNAVLHLDEQTPHIHAIIVPVDKNNRLNCRELFGGKEKLKALQDKTAKAVKHLGIQRGVPKEITEIKHKTTKQWRVEQKLIQEEKNSLSKAIDEIPPIKAPMSLGLVSTKAADEYYKKQAKEQLKKSTAPTMRKYSRTNKELQKSYFKALKEKEEGKAKQEKAEQEAKEIRSENFKLKNIIEKELSEELQRAEKKGYRKAYNEMGILKKHEQDKLEMEQKRLAEQDKKPNSITPPFKPTPIKK